MSEKYIPKVTITLERYDELHDKAIKLQRCHVIIIKDVIRNYESFKAGDKVNRKELFWPWDLKKMNELEVTDDEIAIAVLEKQGE